MKKETRVYGIDSDKITDHLELLALQDHSLNDEQFIEISEEHGLIWSLSGFSHAYNINDISDRIYIRFIEIELHELTEFDNDLYERAE